MGNIIRKLYTKKEDCCGCGACVNICPQNSISLKPDENGFLFPTVDMTNCIDCDLCRKVCAFQNEISSVRKPIKTYVAIHKNRNILLQSSSGGAFSALADIVLAKDGVIYGCAWNENLETEHVCISSAKDLHKLRGSKYVQSNIGKSFRNAKVYLTNGKLVLFSGTPCQIAGLKAYLGKEYDNLITVDLVCHGVPSAAFFKEYISHYEDRIKGKIQKYSFRESGCCEGKIVYIKGQALRKKRTHWRTDSFYEGFMNAKIYRESCYFCKYASDNRQGDFTLGDYWGVEKYHPEICNSNGVSLLLINTNKGLAYIDELENRLSLTESLFDNAKSENAQLQYPVTMPLERAQVFETWHTSGYKAVDRMFRRKNTLKILSFNIRRFILSPIKRRIYNNGFIKLRK